MSRVCPLCGGAGEPFATPVYDDRFGYPGRFTPLYCERCDHGFLDHAFTDEDLGELYTTYYPRAAMSVERHRPLTERTGFHAWLDGARSSASQWVPRNVRVLDIGCGGCESLGYHVARGCEAWGCEADANVAPIAKHFGYKVSIGLFNKDNYPQNYFDFVTLSQVIEHSVDPIAMLRDIASILRADGRLVMTTPNLHGWGRTAFGRRWINWHAPYHLQLFSRRSVTAAAQAAGFDAEIRTLTSSEWLRYQVIHALTFPAEGQVSPFWTGKDPKLNRKIDWLLRQMSQKKIYHLITRLFDAAGIGDSLVVILRKRKAT